MAGALLLSALEQEARNLGFPCVYCGTGTAESLLIRRGWQLIESITHEGQALGIYWKALLTWTTTPRATAMSIGEIRFYEDRDFDSTWRLFHRLSFLRRLKSVSIPQLSRLPDPG